MPEADSDLSARRRGAMIFLTLFVAYGYFHQGGGWNQNVRFDQVRSLAEEGTWWINRYSSYAAHQVAPGIYDLRRRALPDPLPPDYDLRGLNSWDIAIFGGRIYPNKPPGATLLALPAYVLAQGVGRALGLHADSWKGLTARLYLTTVLSVGLVAALGGVLFFQVSRRLFPGVGARRHGAAALAFGLGTIYFPFATMLFDHVAAATALLAGFALLLAACDAPSEHPADPRLLAAGAVLGLAVVINYTAAVAVALLTLYLAWRLRRRLVVGRIGFYLLGGAGPAAFLAWYHHTAFGSFLANANTHQLARYSEPDARLFSMFSLPDPRALQQLLFSDFRGLFVFSPVLALALYGFWRLLRRRERTAEATLFLAVFGSFLCLNASFNNWHAGATFGPRYLIPALPFLALPLTLAFERLPRAAGTVAVLSAVIALLGTATVPLIHFSVEHPLVDSVVLGFFGQAFAEPVSQQALGIYELEPHTFFGPGSFAARWNAFNVGEAMFPHRRLSLLPLLLLLALGTLSVVRRRR